MSDAQTLMADTIGKLLAYIDGLHGDNSMHLMGQTPDWYVAAAYLAANDYLPEGVNTVEVPVPKPLPAPDVVFEDKTEAERAAQALLSLYPCLLYTSPSPRDS